MRCIVFLGPTMPVDEARTIFDALYLPPAAQGDVLRASRESPFAMGIVDGYFERLPAVWHKEILWALQRRIHVFGGSSMGALRAAELQEFGMRGVGEIFRDFAANDLQDDDEVAVAHGEADSGYRASSEAMVNIRATLRAASRAGVVGVETERALEAVAKAMFYPERTFALVCERAIENGVGRAEIDAFRTFVKGGRVDQKRADARALLEAMRECCKDGERPPPASFTLAHTEAWEAALQWVDGQPSVEAGGPPASVLAAEVRLLGAQGRALLAAALNRAMAGFVARQFEGINRSERTAAVERRLRSLVENSDGAATVPETERFPRWLRDRGLSTETYRPFLDRSVDLALVQAHFQDEVDRHLVDELRLSDAYRCLAERAREKDQTLAALGLGDPELSDAGVNSDHLIAWYFRERLGEPVPSDVDGRLSELGVDGREAFEREALRELLYLRHEGRVDPWR